ncbi:PREDICTED: coiled-coil-helix-coiled-coil-helix domain-containing protein 1-like [Priapulus caudatus]|uniref:Coiled-coil-helix-coiled-coil-helix domain-containing protein 1-like n=1 Tax=Priapulus caudatus TaxID=37621 RepID=A0ABM1E5T8_PRICU|nr:PREDICTED: coiled-coil-helix-coiled-coil-helix domain-containing protein 1-like [Priapulus caudatus]
MPSLTRVYQLPLRTKYPIIRYGKYREMLPLKLGDKVSGRLDTENQGKVCINELTLMLSCMKQNEFSQDICTAEITAFETCYNSHLKTESKKKADEAKGIIKEAIGGRLPSQHLNSLLKRYPQPKKKS